MTIRQKTNCRGTQNSNLFQLNANLKMNMVHHLIRRALENGMNNLERIAKWKKTFSCMEYVIK